MKFENFVVLEIPSKSCNEAFVRSAVACFATQLDPTMEELAEACGGFHYEIPCVIGKRVPRLFVYNNQAIGTMVCEDGSYEGI